MSVACLRCVADATAAVSMMASRVSLGTLAQLGTYELLLVLDGSLALDCDGARVPHQSSGRKATALT